MQIAIPIFRQIARDRKLTHSAFQIWCVAIDFLDLVEFRELTLSLIEHQMDVDASTVSRALSTLVAAGYLVRQDVGIGLAPLYRVPLSRIPVTSPSVETSETKSVAPSSEGRAPRGKARVISAGVV